MTTQFYFGVLLGLWGGALLGVLFMAMGTAAGKAYRDHAPKE